MSGLSTISQPCYDKIAGFDSNLEYSQKFVNRVWDDLLNLDDNVYPRPYDDKYPFSNRKKEKKRFCDMEVWDEMSYDFMVECKDFCRCLYYSCTGLPVELADKYYHKCKMRPLFIFFRDNKTYVETKSSDNKTTIEEEEDILIAEGTANRIDGLIEFLPYGGRFDLLMLPENRDIGAEYVPMYRDGQNNICYGRPRVPCGWKNNGYKSRYYDQPQRLFQTASLKPLSVVIPDALAKMRAGYEYVRGKDWFLPEPKDG